MHKRLAGHVYNFARQRKSLYLYFINYHHSYLLEINITLLRVEGLEARLQAETWWVETLDTYLLRGLNTIAPLGDSPPRTASHTPTQGIPASCLLPNQPQNTDPASPDGPAPTA